MKVCTFLCPDCDGWGRTGGEYRGGYGYSADPADYAPEYPCIPCDESGVVHLSREIGEKRGLQPWTGEEGRTLSRNRLTYPEPLMWLANERRAVICVKQQLGSWRERGVASQYRSALDRAAKSTFAFKLFDLRAQRIAAEHASREAEADMLSMASQCVAASERALAEWERAA